MCWEMSPRLSEPRNTLINLFLYSHKLKKKIAWQIHKTEVTLNCLKLIAKETRQLLLLCWEASGSLRPQLTIGLWLIACILAVFSVLLILWSHQLPLCYRISGWLSAWNGRYCECLFNVAATVECVFNVSGPSALPLMTVPGGVFFFSLWFASFFSLPPQMGVNSVSISFLSVPQGCALKISI